MVTRDRFLVEYVKYWFLKINIIKISACVGKTDQLII